jgi:hypothetical protein
MRRLRRAHVTANLLGLAALLAGGAAKADGPEKLEYNRDIRPILAENCFACHGPDSASRKAELRLDRREAAVELGAIAPGDPDSSELVFRVTEADPMVVMPPPSTKKTLTAEQKETLRRWVAEGAEYQPHWSLIPPTRQAPPAVKAETWIRNPIDRFVLAKLEAKEISTAPEADRRTLARRASLDLTGLPPTPEQVEAFVDDAAPDAYERFVDGLMNSPAWGEHRARYWLDAARYADTHGLHFDNFREMWSYRDWVIKAFNKNVPFDRFTVEQLAGDLLPDRTLDQQVASGFNRCNLTTNEGGTIPEENLVGYTRDRTETVSQVWLGLTAGCAVCHDHKFDPLSQREFYEMAAFFNNSTQGAMDGNIKDTPPIVVVPADADRARWDALGGELTEARKQVEDRKAVARAEFDSWLAGSTPETLAALVPSEAQKLRVALGDRFGDAPTTPGSVEIADSGDFEKDQPFSYGAWIRPAKPGLTGSVVARMDDTKDYRGWDLWVEGGRVGTHIISKWEGDALKVVANAELKPGEWTHVLVTYDGSAKAAGVKVYYDGRPQPARVVADALKGSIRATVPLKIGQRSNSSPLADTTIHDLRVFGRAVTPEEALRLAGATRGLDLIALPADKRPEAEVAALYDWWLDAIDGSMKGVRARLDALVAEEAAIKSRGTIAHVMQERPEEAMAYVLYRGDYDKRRDPVKPDTPDALPPMPPELPRNRLGFAQWLLRPDNPLTARVAVNRAWQEIFGTGLVRTAGDFGVAGELPSHPELLDWLAVEFRESGWDMKHLYKLMVTSAAYRQSAAGSPESREKDPENRLLSRGPRFRMDAEMVRDYALAAGGLLSERLGGPSVRPYQPDGVWEAVAMPESNTRLYRHDGGEALYRRSLYTFWKRAAPPASMDIFNAPSRETCTVRRERTNTPLQALVTLNDPQFVEAARHLATLTLKSGESPDERFAFLGRRLLARSFRPEEIEVLRGSLDGLLGHYQANPDDAKALIAVGESKADGSLDAPTLAAWTMLANELMNLDEVLNK